MSKQVYEEYQVYVGNESQPRIYNQLDDIYEDMQDEIQPIMVFKHTTVVQLVDSLNVMGKKVPVREKKVFKDFSQTGIYKVKEG